MMNVLLQERRLLHSRSDTLACGGAKLSGESLKIAKTQPYHSSNLSFIFKVWFKEMFKRNVKSIFIGNTNSI